MQEKNNQTVLVKANKYLLGATIVSFSASCMLAGALFVSSFNANATLANISTPSVIERNTIGISKTDIADKLSNDFINVSKDITPAVVTIASTKIVRQNNNFENEALNDPYFRRFFGIPDNGNQQEQKSKEQSLGSGVIVDDKGLILTNNHVIAGADEIKVTLTDKRVFKAKIIGTDPSSDIAVIKLENANNLPIARLGDSNKLSVGEWVLAIGNPLGLSSTVTSGIISAKGRNNVGVTDFENFIQTDAAINPGNSGGALVNLQGEVIGINTAIASKTGGYMGIGFAIPSNMARKIMNDLVHKGKVSRGYLGIAIQNIDDSIAKSLNLTSEKKGIVVGQIEPLSPAEKAGLKTYDIITSLNGLEVSDVNSFRNAIASADPGQTAKLKVIRENEQIELSVELGDYSNRLAKQK
jgi:serine protease Do